MIDYRENNIWSVYIHISPSNKYYVGITSQNPIKIRWGKEGKGYKRSQYFWRAIQKYGWDNFQHEIFAEHLTKEEACKMEKTLIRELNSNNRDYGYNICSGGEGATGLYGEKNPNYGLHRTDKQRKRMSEAAKKKTYQFNEKGECIGIFNSVNDAAEITKIDRHSISVACANNRKAGNSMWAHENNVFLENGIYKMKDNSYIDKRILNIKQIFQFSPEGIFIRKYNSVMEASDITNINKDTIRSNARHKNKSKNYIWRYKEDVEESVENTGSFLLKEN